MTAWTLSINDNIATLTFDFPHEKVNKLTSAVMEELDQHLDQINKTPNLKALLILSAKKDIFIAGADIAEIQDIITQEEGENKALAGQKVFNKLAHLEIPSIAVIDGATLGGGLEFALACTYRVVSDNPKAQLGLPEVNLGIVPGFGGTQRLPRLLGLQAGLELVLTGKSVDGKKAYKLGLADGYYTQAFLLDQTQEFLRTVLTAKGRKKILKNRSKASLTGYLLNHTRLGQALIFKQAYKTLMAKTKGQYPAPLAALTLIKETQRCMLTQGLALEAKTFAKLVPTPVCKNLIQLFFIQENLKKDKGVEIDFIPTKVSQAGVLGAGLMGGGIAWVLSHVGIRVRLKDINWGALAKGYAAAAKIYAKLVKIKKMTESQNTMAMHLISGTTDYSGFSQAGVVIEAIIEDMEIKKKAFQELETQISPAAIIASNTSSLSITDMASGLSHPERFIGMHFFSPVNKMPLVEVIPGEKTSPETIAAVVQLSKTLKKTPIVVKNVPGFLVNRILIPYVNEAILLLEEGLPIQTLDKAVENFGMPLGPLALADEVGLDIGYKVAKLLEKGYPGRMAVAPIFDTLYADPELRGKKTKQGFYLHSGEKKNPNPKVIQLLKTTKTPPRIEVALDRMILGMVNEAARCLEEQVVAKPDYLDMAMILGTGFPPFRGGLCRYADTRGIQSCVGTLSTFTSLYGARFEPASLLVKMAQENTKFYL